MRRSATSRRTCRTLEAMYLATPRVSTAHVCGRAGRCRCYRWSRLSPHGRQRTATSHRALGCLPLAVESLALRVGRVTDDESASATVPNRERPSLRSRVAPFSLPRLLEIASDQVLQESWNGTAKPCTPGRFRSPPPSNQRVPPSRHLIDLSGDRLSTVLVVTRSMDDARGHVGSGDWLSQ